MNSKQAILPIRLLSALLFSFCLIGWSCEETLNERTIQPGNNLLQVLKQKDNLSIFTAAMDHLGLSSSLENQNLNFTLFAPNNEAFATYLQANNYTRVTDVPEEVLRKLLRYHLSFGRSVGTTLDSARLIDTFDNGKIFVYSTSSASTITLNNQAQIVESSLEANNGIIHVLDGLLTPPALSLADYIASRAQGQDADFTLLQAALQRAELLPLLSSTKNSFTLFAPTDAAFAAAGYATLEDIENTEPAVLKNMLQYHLLPRYRFTGMFTNGDVTSVQGKKVTLSADAKSIKGVGNEKAARLLANEQDVLATNGIFHAIDAVLSPGQ